MIQLILFDLGKVIFDYDFKLTFEYWRNETNVFFDDSEASTIFDEVWDDFEKGIVTPEFVRKHINQLLNINLTQIQFEAGCNSIYLDLYDGIDEILNQLKMKFRIAALSNTNEVHCKVWQNKFEATLSIFEQVFISNEMHARKPEPSIYLQTLELLQVKPNEVLFLDDMYENIKAAELVGIHTIQVHSFAQMTTDLKSFLHY